MLKDRERASLSPQKPHQAVWVLTYSHEHGSDTSVHVNEASALRAIHNTMVRWWEEAIVGSTEYEEKIRQALNAGEVYEAARLWHDVTDEYFCVERCEIREEGPCAPVPEEEED